MQQRPSIIVVGVDYEADGDLAFDTAVQIAGARPASEVHAVHVGAGNSEQLQDKLEGRIKERLEAVMRAHPNLTFERVVTHIRSGSPAQQVVQLAVDVDADLIVVGTHNRKGVKRLLLGSVAERVVHMARCPVYVVRRKDHLELGEVPEIEPPCNECLATRVQTRGEEMWCPRHEAAKLRPRVHRVARGASSIAPEPWSQSTPQV
jgi:nucleotide-binding universal stress UspA family protein